MIAIMDQGGGSRAVEDRASDMPQELLDELKGATGENFARFKTDYARFMTGALIEANKSVAFEEVSKIFRTLEQSAVLGKVRAVDSWSNGENGLRIVRKSWNSVIDKLYRINISENPAFPEPPVLGTVCGSVGPKRSGLLNKAWVGNVPTISEWVTPGTVHIVADDLLRTKIVVPFIDGVVEVSDSIADRLTNAGIPYFKRYHAKDSGYHARHIYILLPVLQVGDLKETVVAFEVKILTKMQDLLGELTHLLYVEQRLGRVAFRHKRDFAWASDSPEFMATYVGHSAHLLESNVTQLKGKIEDLGRHRSG